MKKRMISVFTITALGLALIGCKNKADEAKTSEAETVAVAEITSEKYVANATASTIEWKGFKPTGTHNGTIAISNGELTVKDGEIESGSFAIDMNTITVVDIPAEEEGNAKLKGHLSSPDFFDVAQFPNAKFEVTGIETVEGKTMLSGNLTLKNIENNISFPVNVVNENEEMTLTSETFTIDRTKWNVQYGSKSIFKDLGDRFINDDIEIKIIVKAAKA